MHATRISQAVLDSFWGDIQALKPGNVSLYASGHGMDSRDFIRSAELCTPILCDPSLSFGQRLAESVSVTLAEVGCNTNLGMLLLFLPLILAAERGDMRDLPRFQQMLAQVLNDSISAADTVLVFSAIRTANPGGLGRVRQHDVARAPDCSLLEAMRAASGRDLIARQYSNNFNEVFSVGYKSIKYFVNCWNSVQWATVACYLIYLRLFQDSHILRRHGKRVAEAVRQQAEGIAKRFEEAEAPEQMRGELLDYDKALKMRAINPGTCADLSVASLLVYHLLAVSEA